MKMTIYKKDYKDYGIENVWVIKSVPSLFPSSLIRDFDQEINYILDGKDIRDYVDKYLSKSTFDHITDFIDEQLKNIGKAYRQKFNEEMPLWSD